MPLDLTKLQQVLVLLRNSYYPKDAKLKVKEYMGLKAELSVLNPFLIHVGLYHDTGSKEAAYVVRLTGKSYIELAN